MRHGLLLTVLCSALLLTACQTAPRRDTAVPEPTLVPEPQTELADAAPVPLQSEDNTPLPELNVAPETPDLLDRLRSRLQFDVPNHPDIVAEREWFLRNQDFVARSMGRGSRYLHHILDVFEQHKLPADLALLPVVESAFQAFAYSPSRASGIWQFVPISAKNFGLQNNWWQDERRCVIESTDAAARLLGKLSDIFNGDWQLAIAAYNGGDGYVKRRIAEQRRKGKATDFWSLELRPETSAYVPKLLALIQLLREPEKYGMQWPYVPDQPYFDIVEVGSPIDFQVAAELSGVSTDELHQLNPAFTRWATDPAGPHRLLVPVAAAEKFRQALLSTPVEQRVRWATYKTRNGDTLASISQQFDVDADSLKSINKLKGNSLKAGSTLFIPRQDGSNAPALIAAPLTVLAKRHLAAQESGVPVSKTGTALSASGSHKVQTGDTLWTIARRYNLSMQALMNSNGLNAKSRLKPGQILSLGNAVADTQTTRKKTDAKTNTGKLTSKKIAGRTETTTKVAGGGSEANGKKITYTIRSGDSLYEIAQRFNIKLADLQRWNRNSSKVLRPGQELVIWLNADPIGG